MATITARKRKNGTRYTAQIRTDRNGERYTESATFSKRVDAVSWAKKREVALDSADGKVVTRGNSISVRQVLQMYMEDFSEQFGRSKKSHIKYLINHSISDQDALSLTPKIILKHVIERRKTVSGATANNDLIWLRRAFKAVRLTRDLPLDVSMLLNCVGLKSLYLNQNLKVEWQHLDCENKRILVRDIKHPKHKKDTWVNLTDEAISIISRMPNEDNRIFPFNSKSVGSSFTRTCDVLGIENLRFHDLRHECASWLFELGYDIPRVSKITGHLSWNTLQRYTHFETDKNFNKYHGWKWLG